MKTFWNATSKGTVGRIDIYDYIDFYGVNAAQFSKDWQALEEKSASIEVHINSPGGNLFDGITIYNRIQHSKVPVETYNDGLAASSASIIFMAGQKNHMASNAMLMVHNASTVTYGNEQDHEATIVMLKAAKKALMVAYKEKTGKSEDEIAALLDANNGAGTWMGAEEAKDFGFVDEITGELKVAAKFDIDDYGYDVPAQLLARWNKKPEGPAKKKEAIAMADKSTEPEAQKPATLAEIESACEGASSDFVLAQFKANATLAQVGAAWAKQLKAERDKAKQELADAKKAQVEAEEQAAKTKPGNKAVKSQAAAAAESDGDDPVERFHALVNAKVSNGLDRSKAVVAVAKSNKELHKAFLLATNGGLKARRQIEEKYDE